MKAKIRENVFQVESEIVELRRYFHENPELSLYEEKTSLKIQEILNELSIPYEVVGEYGLIAYLKGKTDGKTVMLRADMDALPVDEGENNLKNKKNSCSLIKGVSHACGHDAHMAMMLGALKVLVAMRDELEGNVVFVFEQAEEIGRGVFPMMEALKKYSIDTSYAIHLYAELQEGKISVQPGARMAALTAFTVRVKGKGGHGSRPDLTINPLMCTANILVNLNNIWSQELDPTKVVTMGITTMQCGEKGNVIPDFAEFSGSLRYTDIEEGKKAFTAMKRVCEGVALAHRCHIEYPKILESPYVVWNDKICSQIAEKGIKETMGEEYLGNCPMWFATESMAVYQKEYPGVFAFLGIKNEEKGYGAGHHTKEFDFNEEILKYGTMSAVSYVFEYFNNEKER